MTAEAWAPPDYDLHIAAAGYLHYITGASILHDPTNTAALHRIELRERDDLDTLILSAEELMVGGMRRVIKHCNVPSLRHSRRKMGLHFDEAGPHMATIVDVVFAQKSDRMHVLGPALDVLRPAPMLNETIYRYLCQGKYGKIHTLWLMDELPPAFGLESRLNGRTLTEYAAKYVRPRRAA